MEPIILFILVIGLLFLGVPVAISLGLSSILIVAFFSADSMSSVAIQLFTASQNYTLLAIPFFVLASAFMSTGGVAKRIIRFAISAVGHFRDLILADAPYRGWNGFGPALPLVVAEPHHDMAIGHALAPLARRKEIGIAGQQDAAVFESQ